MRITVAKEITDDVWAARPVWPHGQSPKPVQASGFRLRTPGSVDSRLAQVSSATRVPAHSPTPRAQSRFGHVLSRACGPAPSGASSNARLRTESRLSGLPRSSRPDQAVGQVRHAADVASMILRARLDVGYEVQIVQPLVNNVFGTPVSSPSITTVGVRSECASQSAASAIPSRSASANQPMSRNSSSVRS